MTSIWKANPIIMTNGGMQGALQPILLMMILAQKSKKKNISELMEEVRERINKLRQRGIAEYLLEQLIHPDNRLGRLVITKDWRIILPDYNDMEIKMEPLVKAVYLLFLRHPEGIAFKQLPDYREELTRLYNQLKPSGLTDSLMITWLKAITLTAKEVMQRRLQCLEIW